MLLKSGMIGFIDVVGNPIDNSALFDGASSYLTRTPPAGDQNNWTWSAWVKKSNTGRMSLFTAGTSSTNYTEIEIDVDGRFTVLQENTSIQIAKRSTALIRDVSAWYHLAVSIDITNATAEDRVKMYINGVRITDWYTNTNPANTNTTVINTAVSHKIGRRPYSADSYYNGYMSEVHFVDGATLIPDEFGETNSITGEWVPKLVSGITYGTNGFYLPMTETVPGTFDDLSGNGNDFTNVSSAVEISTDTPTNNTCTLNYLNKYSLITLEEAGRYITATGGNIGLEGISGTMMVSNGKWYFEYDAVYMPATRPYAYVGVARNSVDNFTVTPTLNSFSYYSNNGNISDFSASNSAYGASWTTSGTVIGVALDMDSGTIEFFKDNISQGSTAIDTSEPLMPHIMVYKDSATAGSEGRVHFAEAEMEYPIPTGYQAFELANLSIPEIIDSTNYFQTILDTGANILTSAQASGFDLFWIKDRVNNTTDHQLIDTERGGTLTLEPSTPDNERAYIAPSGDSVAWCFKKKTGFFDIVKYTGDNNPSQLINHSLGVKPELILVKNITTSFEWRVYHSVLGATKGLILNTSAAQWVSSVIWSNAEPTITQFTVDTDGSVNQNDDYIAYLFASVEGFCKIDSYVGNGSSTDGTFVNCGFKPKFIMWKRTDVAASWNMFDTARDTYNVCEFPLYPDLNAQEGSGIGIVDIVSNGFKFRNAGTGVNVNGGTYVYIAIAEAPENYARAR